MVNINRLSYFLNITIIIQIILNYSYKMLYILIENNKGVFMKIKKSNKAMKFKIWQMRKEIKFLKAQLNETKSELDFVYQTLDSALRLTQTTSEIFKASSSYQCIEAIDDSEEEEEEYQESDDMMIEYYRQKERGFFDHLVNE